MPTPLPPPQPSTGHFAENDSAQMIKLLELEILNRRAKRLAGGENNRQTMRMFGILMIFGLLAAAMAMTWFMQTSRLANRLEPHQRAAAMASPAPAASAPPAGPARGPAPTGR